MRFTTAWANVVNQNVVLRFVVLSLSLLLIGMTMVTGRLAIRSPLIVERACYATILPTASEVHTETEISAFVRESLRQRFDSDAAVSADFMGVDEFRLRIKEQDEMSRRQMKQRIIVNGMTKKDDTITVDADRIISVGSIRSAFSSPIAVTISNVGRSEANPYGLVLTKVMPATGNPPGGPNDKK